MMNFSPLSNKAWAHITRAAVSWEERHSSDVGFHYAVFYPNGAGIYIDKNLSTKGWEDDLWEITPFKDGNCNLDSKEFCLLNSLEKGRLTEYDVVSLCDEYFRL